jgi:hypothetical protein
MDFTIGKYVHKSSPQNLPYTMIKIFLEVQSKYHTIYFNVKI